MTVFILHVTVHKMRLVRLVWKESGLSKPIKASELRFKRGFKIGGDALQAAASLQFVILTPMVFVS